tara:strand:+ start:48454 stop:49536 length:1083 start_codon:yes stop_codon:yes gene_type:complete
MLKIVKQFPIFGQYTYVNTAASGLMYDDLLDWRQEHDLDFLIGGSNLKLKAHKMIGDTRETVGRFFSCKTENVALVPNFSIGLNMLLEGFDRQHRVLLLEGDYPSLNWPFESRGFPIVKIPVDANLEDHILQAVKNDGITVVALSIVQWLNGIKVDLEFLKGLKEQFPELIIIADGTQFCGTESFDFGASGIDIMGASAYKWLLGGYGNGFFMFKEDIEQHFAVKTIGFNSSGLNAKDNEIPFVKLLEPGHLDTYNFGSLKFSLDFLDRIGMDQITAQLQRLSILAKAEFSKLGLLEEAVISRKAHSTIFNLKGDEKLLQQLAQEDVICSLRGDGIRVSFHFYNTEKDIHKIVKIIRAMA